MGLFDRLLDGSVVFSFDRSGYARHGREFDPLDLDVSMRGKTCLVTGANSGLGLELARGLAAREATVHMLCRSEQRGAAAVEDVAADTGNQEVQLELVDLSRRSSIRAFAAGFSPGQIDVLVHNAGLLPLEREVTPGGFELTVATHVVGPFLLTTLLRPRLVGARVIFVSSGGMYARRLDLDTMLSLEGDYDGVAAYAMTKRAQVVLSELWADELAGQGTVVNAMHPGWAETAGVERSLPRFWSLMRGRLRTASQGADTALWLAVAREAGRHRGKFWFDRRPARTHLGFWTRESEAQRERLWRWCEQVAGA